MSLPIVIESPDGSHLIDGDGLPLSIGNDDADIQVPGAGNEVLAYIDEDDDQLFIQPAEAARAVHCNGDLLTSSQWLRDGDLVRIGQTQITVRTDNERIRLAVEQIPVERAAEPELTPPPKEATSAGSGDGQMIAPAAYTPTPLPGAGGKRVGFRPVRLLAWIVVALLGATVWFTFTARTVEVRVDPQPEALAIEGTLLQFQLGGRYLLRPGTYTVTAEREGFRRLEQVLDVTHEPTQVFDFALERLPGLLTVETHPASGVTVLVDRQDQGVTPIEPISLTAGTHTIEAAADRHESASTTVEIEGAGSELSVELTLRPLWAPVTFDSNPAGADIRIDGTTVGQTPATVDVLEGSYLAELRLDGYKPYRTNLQVAASEPLSPRVPVLEKVDGWLSLTTEPAGAQITIDGEFRGRSPLEIELRPEVPHELSASLRGHRTIEESISIDSGRTRELNLELEAEIGEIEIVASPADAELVIDGVSLGAVGQTLRLPAVPHQIEIHREGFETVRREITPRPGFPQTLEIELRSEEEVRRAARKPIIATSQGQEMRLIEPGSFRMGASRREPGRRSNESLRDVELTRPFYLATEEVSNKEFREFRDSHRAGQINGNSLDLDDHPVVEVTWEDSARYCNWLSSRESLQPAYVESNGKLEAAVPMTDGYRLPTEAEWAWVARYGGGETALKYPWGDSLPVATGSGNYADAAATGTLPSTISGYNDTFAATAPVDSFQANRLGIFQLGGNVAEWAHDHYSIYSSNTTSIDQDPSGPPEGEYHVIRGSSWMDSTITELRLSYRDYGNKRRSDLGFRIARYSDQAKETP